MVRVRLWLPMLLLVVSASLAGAQEESVPRADDIVVRARTQEPAEVFQDTPVETEVITREEVQTIPARDVSDIVARTPGIRAQPRIQGQDAAVSIEGMPPEYSLLLVDGELYSGEIGGVGDLADFPITNVDRIEILRGAQALRYGSSAAGGVINLITRPPPTEGVAADGEGGAGDDGYVKALGTVGYGNETLGGALSYTEEQIDGFDPDSNDAVLIRAGDESQEVARDAEGVVRWEPNDALTFVTRGGFRREHETLRFSETSVAFVRNKRWRGLQSIEWIGETSRAYGSFFYYRNDLDSELGRPFELDEDQWKAEGVFDHFFDTGPVSHALSLGFDARVERIRLQEGGEIFDPTGGDESIELVRENIQRGALYAIVESELTRWLTFEAGARAEFHSEFDPNVVPQIALLVTPIEQLKLRASWGLGYRAPSLRDLYQPPVPQLGGLYFLEGNPDLDTESSTSYRLGFEWTPDDRISLAGTFFYNSIDDHIRSTFAGSIVTGTGTSPPVPIDTDRPGLDLICRIVGNVYPECGSPRPFEERANLFQKKNLDTVRTRGFESRVELRPHPLVLGQVGYTYLETSVIDAELPDVDELPNEAKHTIDALLSLEAPRIRTKTVLRGRWRDGALTEGLGTGSVSASTGERADDSFVLDLRVLQPLRYKLTLFADVYNVTDESVVDSYAIRGRTFFVGLRGEFPWW